MTLKNVTLKEFSEDANLTSKYKELIEKNMTDAEIKAYFEEFNEITLEESKFVFYRRVIGSSSIGNERAIATLLHLIGLVPIVGVTGPCVIWST